MTARKTIVLIDEELLSKVQVILETKTVKDTIEHAFLEVLRSAARAEDVRALSSLRGMVLDDDEAMKGAWRR